MSRRTSLSIPNTPTGQSPRSKNEETEDGFSDFCVKSIALAEVGRREIDYVEREMKGLLELRRKYVHVSEGPLKGAFVIGCTHMTAHTAVMIETLVDLGAEVRWCASNIWTTEDHVAAAIADRGIPVFAWKGMEEEDFWWALEKTISADGWQPNLIIDDGGEATVVVHRDHPELLRHIKGITEEDLIGVHRMYQMAQKGELKAPAMNVNDSVTKTSFDNRYRCRETLVDSIKRATDITLGGKHAVVFGYGARGHGCCEALRGLGCHVFVVEVDPIMALMACMEGYRVVRIEDVVKKADIFVTATGSRNVIRKEHMEKMRNGAILCNIGHFDQEINVDEIRSLVWEKIKPEVDKVLFPSGKHIILLGEGRLVDMTCSNGHPSFVLSVSLTNNILAIIELFQAPKGKYHNEVYKLPRHLDEDVARLHLKALHANLTQLTKSQASYMGVNPQGPFKGDAYKYC